MRQHRWFDRDHVTGPDITSGKYDAHDTGFSDQRAVGVPVEHRGHQPGLEFVELNAGIAQPGDFDDSIAPEMQPRAGWQREQIDAARRDVLAEVTRHHRVAACAQFLEQLSVDEMHLAQVRLGRIARHARTMFHRRATMGVAEPYPGLLRSFEFRQRPRVVCDSTPAFLEVPGKVLLRQSNLGRKGIGSYHVSFSNPGTDPRPNPAPGKTSPSQPST